jgi:hypothetical protein
MSVFKGEQRYGNKEIKGLVECGVIEFLTKTACHNSTTNRTTPLIYFHH